MSLLPTAGGAVGGLGSPFLGMEQGMATSPTLGCEEWFPAELAPFRSVCLQKPHLEHFHPELNISRDHCSGYCVTR